jgi:membrane associated rhomboid family serine protease
MESNLQKNNFRKVINIIFIPTILSLLILLVFLLEKGMDWNFSKAGIYPRKPEWIWTIFTFIFVHANWSHLFNNLLSFFLLSSCLFYFYRPVNLRIFVLLWFLSGIMLWVIGRESRHVGASGLIYAIAAFLLFSGLIRRHIPLIAISLVVTLIYGNMIWHIFPWTVSDPVSWEGHLSGLITGLLVAIIFRNDGPQKPVKVWEEDNIEDESNDEFWLTKENE